MRYAIGAEVQGRYQIGGVNAIIDDASLLNSSSE